ncbi:MAG: DUF523 and DUF1722 domain-containing protein [Thermodesulfovibrionales bacterium]|nr:DUF523 and DUF1722 domain-containing protein [Thermodesulfovibrionales bacterium]
MKGIKIGISSCLLGERVRYDGSHKLNHFLKYTLGRFVEWVPVCPEVEYGLPVPRQSLRLYGSPDNPRLIESRTGIDHTDGMRRWIKSKLDELEKEELCGFVFKSNSPSSGLRNVRVYGPSGIPSRTGIGLFAAAFIRRFPLIPVEDDGRLNNPVLRENFIERIFVYKRWQDLKKTGSKIKEIIEFHRDHKFLILAHSPKHYKILGNLLASHKKGNLENIKSEYISNLMECLRLIATVKKNTNVLLHIMGYFRKLLNKDEKEELLEIIENYHKGYIPLVVPITLIRHYVRKFNIEYLSRQYYLNPHPVELMLRNHV